MLKGKGRKIQHNILRMLNFHQIINTTFWYINHQNISTTYILRSLKVTLSVQYHPSSNHIIQCWSLDLVIQLKYIYTHKKTNYLQNSDPSQLFSSTSIEGKTITHFSVTQQNLTLKNTSTSIAAFINTRHHARFGPNQKNKWYIGSNIINCLAIAII